MKLGDYEVVSEIFSGSSSKVFLGRTAEGRHVAIKVLTSEREPMYRRFCREERLLGLLRQENGFVPLLDKGMSEQGPFLVMPFLPGGTLRRRMSAGPMPVRDVIELGCTIASALGRAHALGIVHRDLKPENVLLDESGRPLVADLGLAKHFDADTPGGSQSSAITRSEGGLIGTLGYMAPEQTVDPRGAGPPADVFSLGAVLYECLTGVPAFSGESVAQVVRKVLGREGSVAKIATLRPDAPPELVSVVEKMLERDPARRLEDGFAVLVALDVLRPRSTRPLKLGVAALAALAVTAVFLSRPKPAAPVPVAAPPPPPPVPVAVVPATTPPSVIPEAYRSIVSGQLVLESVHGQPKAGHSGTVRQVAFSADGKRALTLGEDGKLRDWDVATGAELAVLPGPIASGTIATLSDDGARAIVRTPERGIRVLDVAARSVGPPLAADDVSSRSVRFTPDGGHIIIRERGGRAEIIDVVTGETRPGASLPRMGALAFSKDGELSAAAQRNGEISVFDMAKGEEMTRVGRAGLAVSALAFLPGEMVAAAREDGVIDLWSAGGGKARSFLSQPAASLAGSPDGACIFAGGQDGTLRVLRSDDGTLVASLALHHRAIVALAVSKDGSRVLTGSADGTARVAAVDPFSELMILGSPGAEIATLVAVDGRLVAGLGDGSVSTLDLATGKSRVVFAEQATKRRFGERPLLAPDGGAALVRVTTAPALVDVATGSLVPVALPPGDGIHGAVFSPDGKTLVAGSPAGIRVLARATGDMLREIADPDAASAWVVGVKRDERVVALAREFSVRVWSFETSASTAALGTRSVTLPLALSPEGERLLSVTRSDAPGSRIGGKLVLWDLPSGTRLRELPSDRSIAVLSVAFSPDGWLGLASCYDRTVRLWDLATGQSLETVDLGPTDDRPAGVAFAPDGKTVFVGTARGVVLRFALKRK